MGDATDDLLTCIAAGATWADYGDKEAARAVLRAALKERAHSNMIDRVQVRANLQNPDEKAAWAGYINAENPTSGPYQGTSFVWFPSKGGGSVVVLVIGTQGFGPDAHVLGSPGHRRRLRALSRMHAGALWVKGDPLDLNAQVPEIVCGEWPRIDKAKKTYRSVIYAAVPFREGDEPRRVLDLLDLYLEDTGVHLVGKAKTAWSSRRSLMLDRMFPRRDTDQLEALVRDRRFVILEGPPGTGKTRAAFRELAPRLASSEMVQFNPARSYEDFVIGLAPRVAGDQLAFEVRAGDLVRANQSAEQHGEHLLIIDEINRGDLARVLGEAIALFEVGAEPRTVRLAHAIPKQTAKPHQLRLHEKLFVIGTRNTADRSIARLDLAIRRRFAFVQMWPSLGVVQQEQQVKLEGSTGKAVTWDLAARCFQRTLQVFTEHADDDGLELIPGHAYFLDPHPNLAVEGRPARVRSRLRHELVPLLRDYVSERLLGPATARVEELADWVEGEVEADERAAAV